MGAGEWEHNLADLRDKNGKVLMNMMAQFPPAFYFTLGNEDESRSGIVTPEPCGGHARFGINSEAHPEMPPEFWTMTPAEALPLAEDVYHRCYWNLCLLDYCADQSLANKILDTGFWLGPIARASHWAQMAANALGATLVIDCHLGPKSWAAINALDSLALRNAMIPLIVAHIEADALKGLPR